MRKTTNNLILCNMVFAVSLVISNVITAKLIDTGIPLFGTAIALPAAVLCYPVTFLMTDVIGEIWGRKEANKTVMFGFICQCLSTILVTLTSMFPAANPEVQGAYETLLGQSWIFFIGSMTAYYASQSWDVWVFHKIRTKLGENHKKRWIWNNASTMTSQIIDTVLFISISFGFGYGWYFQPEMWSTIAAMMVGQYGIKFIEAALDTPLFYLLTRKK